MTKSICVWYWFVLIPNICPFWEPSFWTTFRYSVNNISCDKGVCANSAIGYCRNNATVGYVYKLMLHYLELKMHILV